ncbi:AGAP003620-PA-like protein [Anopheles sinensis]|uniref:AGAP003620-PA-like protein n=1 Tax=Anopheles sinensis TaxID=74873 RepID=A0A084WSG7_ANOSI|nr:AGAP003620-PA-like protein [Anopheles sinensis]
MQDRSCTVAKQSQNSTSTTNGSMKKGQSPTSQTKANATSGGSWGPHFKSREHFNSMHFS